MAGKFKNFVDVLATGLLAISASLFIWSQVESRWLSGRVKPSVEDVKNLSIQAPAIRHIKGSGAVVLVEFTDYQCPFCRAYAAETARAVDAQLVEAGLLRHVVLNFPIEAIHPRARPAAEAAECAGRQGRYWEMHAHLFADPNNLVPNALIGAAKVLGLDEISFAHCLSGEATDHISADVEEARRLGVKGTPAFFVGTMLSDGSIDLMKRLNGKISVDDLKRTIAVVRPLKRAGG
jgi:protein-disulfide isomerase